MKIVRKSSFETVKSSSEQGKSVFAGTSGKWKQGKSRKIKRSKEENTCKNGSEKEAKECILCALPGVYQGKSRNQQGKRISRKNRTSKKDSEPSETVSERPEIIKNHEKS